MATSPSSPTTTNDAARVSSVLLEEWDALHNEFRKQIIHLDTEKWQLCDKLSSAFLVLFDFLFIIDRRVIIFNSGLKRVAGVDISIQPKDSCAQTCEAFVAVVICEFPTMKLIHEETEKVYLNVPYVPGYLAFRESATAVKLLAKITRYHPDKIPDVLLVDGNGILHPHRCGLACHIGLQSSIPSIGVAKNMHLIEGVNIADKSVLQSMDGSGDFTLITNNANETIGMALKTTRTAKNPIYISVGHKISLATAKRVVLRCCKFRVPDPIRFADNVSRELIRKMEREMSLPKDDK